MQRYVYIVIEVGRNMENPRIKGVFWKKKDAEKEAYKDSSCWCNIIRREVV